MGLYYHTRLSCSLHEDNEKHTLDSTYRPNKLNNIE